MRNRKILALTALIPLLMSPAGVKGQGWDFDSIRPVSTQAAINSPAQEVSASLIDMLANWNAHDLERYLGHFWNSPDLMIVADQRQYSGWQSLHDIYTRGFQEPGQMGFLTPDRIQVRMIRPDLAFALTAWSLRFPEQNDRKVFGIDTAYLQKLDNGWKIISGHTSTTD
jgi:uncharacterized protein (TIGR02246 family)